MAESTVKYVAVREHLEGRIATMSPGDQLPTEPKLCEEYGVSRITIRRAVEELIRTGRLVREQGRGTFVTEPRFTQELRKTSLDRITGFYGQQSGLGREVTSVVLANLLTRHEAAAAVLGFNIADELIKLERLRYVNGALHQHVVTFLPPTFEGVLAHDFSRGSLYDYLTRTYGVTFTHNTLRVRVDHTGGRTAAALQVADGTAVLAVDSVLYGTNQTPIAFGIATHTPGNSELTIDVASPHAETPGSATPGPAPR